MQVHREHCWPKGVPARPCSAWHLAWSPVWPQGFRLRTEWSHGGHHCLRVSHPDICPEPQGPLHPPPCRDFQGHCLRHPTLQDCAILSARLSYDFSWGMSAARGHCGQFRKWKKCKEELLSALHSGLSLVTVSLPPSLSVPRATSSPFSIRHMGFGMKLSYYFLIYIFFGTRD